MATFSVPVVRIRAIEPIPGADAIELAVVGDYRSVIGKDRWSAGDLAIYLPEASVLPEALIEELGLVGKLAGGAKNRIKAIKLRGCLSQGILYGPVPVGVSEGDDMGPALGVVKYEPPVPAAMAGEVLALFNVPGGPVKFDVENIKAYPDMIAEGEMVEMTEKAHGTFCGIGIAPGQDNPELFGGDGLVYSKGLGGRGLVFKDVPENDGNIYVQAARAMGLHDKLRKHFPGWAVHVLGEVYGPGVQDLHYGRKERGFAAFDICVNGEFVDPAMLRDLCTVLEIDVMPPLYVGPFSKDALEQATNGPTVLGNTAHIREGVVVRPLKGRRDDRIGRVILKSVSAAYLLRKGEATEFS